MSPEEARTLVAENEALHAQGLGLRPQVAKVAGQLQTAEERIAELEKRKAEPLAFVTPNGHSRWNPTGAGRSGQRSGSGYASRVW